ncbi:hypothetical protein ABIF29_000150 [Bradyrhizobium elkanii]|jgi:hypothetical protein|uniref:Uncharacterized protein n=1 Tax=Bradyrhizobium elkanii TaxID=29448 RepID=A0ABV4EQD7_BRAEL|nr:hypothetical protein [Bradyrhizobium elkanii]MCP1975699.1 hypothetical protein [Bradyrhizobium elkanii]MCS4113047.1 hypothetical protein [Bradyrhizobium elkanii]MCW2117676.1 hypothetical protein [Bradyrhizobium elkanii]MCW2197755.1 hypothetical protein [Bradyrhizobium elkanii]
MELSEASLLSKTPDTSAAAVKCKLYGASPTFAGRARFGDHSGRSSLIVWANCETMPCDGETAQDLLIIIDGPTEVGFRSSLAPV